MSEHLASGASGASARTLSAERPNVASARWAHAGFGSIKNRAKNTPPVASTVPTPSGHGGVSAELLPGVAGQEEASPSAQAAGHVAASSDAKPVVPSPVEAEASSDVNPGMSGHEDAANPSASAHAEVSPDVTSSESTSAEASL